MLLCWLGNTSAAWTLYLPQLVASHKPGVPPGLGKLSTGPVKKRPAYHPPLRDGRSRIRSRGPVAGKALPQAPELVGNPGLSRGQRHC